MGNSIQTPVNNQDRQGVKASNSSQAEEKVNCSSSSEGERQPVAVVMPINSNTTQYNALHVNDTVKEQQDEFVMIETSSIDESVGMSSNASVLEQERLHGDSNPSSDQQFIIMTVEEPNSSSLSDSHVVNEAYESTLVRHQQDDMIDFDAKYEDIFATVATATIVDDPTSTSPGPFTPANQQEKDDNKDDDPKYNDAVNLDTADHPEKPLKSSSTNSTTYGIGDHVYQWCSLAGIPGVFQHHGIVIGVQPAGEETYLTIVDFSNVLPFASSGGNQKQDNVTRDENITTMEREGDEDDSHLNHTASTSKTSIQQEEGMINIQQEDQEPDETETVNLTADTIATRPPQDELPQHKSPQRCQREPYFFASTSSTPPADVTFSSSPAENILSLSYPDSVRTYTISSHKWHKVVYQANLWQRHLWRSGTCTSAASDPPGLVMARVFFLMHHRHLVPKYHVLQSNCECMAVWCKTGQWSTLQAMSMLSVAAASQVKQATTLAAIAASQQVTVPASGFMGMLGYTTQVSLVSTQPYLLPAIGLYGALTVAIPMLLLNQAQRAWKRTTDLLTQEFWNHAVKEPETFAECITYWSSRSSSEEDANGSNDARQSASQEERLC
jgi:hypothetical protein